VIEPFSIGTLQWSGAVMDLDGSTYQAGQVRTAVMTVSVTAQVTGTETFTVSCSVSTGESVIALQSTPGTLLPSLAITETALRTAGDSFTMAMAMLVVPPFLATGTVQLQWSATGSTGVVATSNLTLTMATSALPTLLACSPSFRSMGHQSNTSLSVALHGLNLDALPHRLMVGPYLVRITHGSTPNEAVAHLPPAVTCGQVQAAASLPVFSDGIEPTDDTAYTARQVEVDSNFAARVQSLCTGKDASFLLTADLFHWHLRGNSTTNPTQWAPVLQMELTSLRVVATMTDRRRQESFAFSNNDTVVLEAGDSATSVRLTLNFVHGETNITISPEDLGLYTDVPYTTSVSSAPGKMQPIALTNTSAAAVDFELSAAMDQEGPISLYLQRAWGPRQYDTILTIPVQRPSLSLTAVQVSRWVSLFTLSVDSTWGSARNVRLEVSPEAAVLLLVSSNSTYCTSGLQCAIPTLAAGSPIQIYANVSHRLNYNFNGAATLRFTLEAGNAQAAVKGMVVMSPSSADPLSTVPKPPSAVAQSHSVFGSHAAVQCIDPLFFTLLAVLLLLLLALGVQAILQRLEKKHSSQQLKTYQEVQTTPALHQTEEVAVAGSSQPVGVINDEAVPATAAQVAAAAETGSNKDKRVVDVFQQLPIAGVATPSPLWHALLLHHRYLQLLVPCRAQCVISHALLLCSHLMCLLLLVSVSALLLHGPDVNVSYVWGAAFLALLVNSGLQPLWSMCYWTPAKGQQHGEAGQDMLGRLIQSRRHHEQGDGSCAVHCRSKKKTEERRELLFWSQREYRILLLQ
jgi:hypothetical protein